ncbi:MAG: 4-hydroxy-tetrahydrodipicolinate synthase [Vicingaceae bacterium]
MKNLSGTGVALVTPFKTDGSIDFDGLSNLVEHVIKGGVNYLVVLGTTGESITLTDEEQVEVLEHVKKVNASRLPIVLGIGGNNTQKLLAEFKRFNLDGVTAILSSSPSYNKPTQEGIYQHFKKLAEAAPLPIILYNVPGRTASNMTAKTTLRLANDFKNIIGIKEASADLNQVMEIIKNKPDKFLLISGEDGLTFPMIACGGAGVISVVANSQPTIFAGMVREALNGDFESAKKKHYQLMDFINLLFEQGNPGGVKAALKNQGVCGDQMRLPLWNVDKGLESRIGSELKSL